MEGAAPMGTDGPSARGPRPARGLRFLLLGFALSLPVHASIVAWLALTFIERPGIPATEAPAIELVSLPGEDAPAPASADRVPEPDVGAESPRTELSRPDPSPPGSGLDDALLGVGTGAADGLGDLATVPGDGFGGGSGSGGGGGFGGGAGGTSFFGVGGRGTRFAFIVDKSGSMLGDRIARAKEELARSIAALPDFASVHVAFFDAGEPVAFTDGWERIRSGSMQRFRAWLRGVSASGDTQPMAAFRQAFALEPRPDVVFFLTDGAIPQECPEQVRALNARGKRVQVNAIAFDDGRGSPQLRQIAQESGGQFREVRAEPPSRPAAAPRGATR